MLTERDLIEAIDAHLASTGQAETSFGTEIANDPSLVADLRRGRSPRLRLVNRILEAIEAAKVRG